MSDSVSASETITVRVLLFSVLREAVGTGEVTLTLLAGATAEDALDALAARHETIAQYRTHTRPAVNERYVEEAHPLTDGDELALITPVSGG